MDYQNANRILPKDLLDLIQEHIDGTYLYIPRKETNRKSWGELKDSKSMVKSRNLEIYEKYRQGDSVQKLANVYYLSPKTIYKILSTMKTRN